MSYCPMKPFTKVGSCYPNGFFFSMPKAPCLTNRVLAGYDIGNSNERQRLRNLHGDANTGE